MTKNKLLPAKQAQSIIIILVVLVTMALFIYWKIDEFKQIRIENWYAVILLIASQLVNIISNGLLIDEAVKTFSVKMSKSTTFHLAVVTKLINQIIGKSGLIARAIYLKRAHKLSYANYSLAVAATHIYIFIGVTLSGVAGSLALSSNYRFAGIAAFGAATLGLTLITWPASARKLQRHIPLRGKTILSTWLDINSRTALNKNVLIIVAMILLSQTAVVWSSFAVIGISLSVFEALLIMAVSAIGVIIGISPGGIGIVEGLTVAATTAVGITSSEGLSAALIQRAAIMLIVVSIGAYSSHKLGMNFLTGQTSSYPKK